MPESSPDCSEKGIPAHLHQLDRGEDQGFLPTEALYRHFDKALLQDRERLYEVFTTRRMSLNREKYSESPADVLYNINGPPHHANKGIARLTVGDVQAVIERHPTQNPAPEYRLGVTHKPERCMYPHCEVEVFEDGVPVAEIKPASVKTKIKRQLLRVCRIEAE